MDSTRYGQGRQTHVRLLVKAPDQQIDDQTVECTLEWTVAMLKDHLTQVYPSKPKREEQKIIFLGQLLNNSMILKDVLQQNYNKEDNLFIIHLVCSGQPKLLIAKTGVTVNLNRHGATFVSVPSGLARPTPVQQYYSQLNNQQMAWMQQAYAHYIIRYMQIMAAQGIQVESNPLYAQPHNVNTGADETTNIDNVNFNNNNNVQENELAQGPGLAIAGGALADQEVAGDANNNDNAPANEVAGGAAVNRDWLDVFDMLSRIVVLSSIVYFYSSPSRFLIVTFLGFAIYLIQGGFFRGQPGFLVENNNARIIDNNHQVRPNEAIPPGDQIPAPAQPAPRIQSGSPEEQHVEASRTTNAERPSAWAFTWTFFSSFFASLIPDQPNVI